MCLSRPGVRSISGFSRALKRNGAIGVHELHLEHLDRRHIGEQHAPRVPVAEIDLLQILIELAGGEEVGSRDELLVEQRHLRQQRRGRSSAPARRPICLTCPPAPDRLAEQPRTCSGCSRSAVRLGRHHVRVEVRRTPNGLAGVVDDEVEALARGDEVAAERLDARRVPQIEAEDLEPVAPVAEVGLLRVARRRVPRKPGRDDQVRAGAQQLQAGLIADLDAPAGQQRDTAAQVRELGARGEVDVGAGGAELIVEVVDAASTVFLQT